MKHLIIKFSLVLLVALQCFNASAQTVATVGNSASAVLCDYPNIQAAIDSGATEVRVLNNRTFNEHLFIDRSIDIKGGYPNCLKAETDQPSGGNTEVNASGSPGLPVW